MDEQGLTNSHSESLTKALRAYGESADFYPNKAQPDEEVNLQVVIGGHNTPVLRHTDKHQLNTGRCLREYMAYAEQEFLSALGREQIASQALYGLGRLEVDPESGSASSQVVRAHRSLALYQTALKVDNQNFAAANEMGVLLAKYGKYHDAIDALQHCVQLSPQPTAWKNLSNIHRKLGEVDQARAAEAEANRALRATPGTPFVAAEPRVDWVDARTFAQVSPGDALNAPNNTPKPTAKTPQQPVETANKGKLWFFGRK